MAFTHSVHWCYLWMAQVWIGPLGLSIFLYIFLIEFLTQFLCFLEHSILLHTLLIIEFRNWLNWTTKLIFPWYLKLYIFHGADARRASAGPKNWRPLSLCSPKCHNGRCDLLFAFLVIFRQKLLPICVWVVDEVNLILLNDLNGIIQLLNK